MAGCPRIAEGCKRWRKEKKTRKTLWQSLDVRFVHNVDSVMGSWDEACQNIKLCILYTEIAKQQCCLDSLQHQSNFPHLYLFLYPHYSFPVFPILSSAFQIPVKAGGPSGLPFNSLTGLATSVGSRYLLSDNWKGMIFSVRIALTGTAALSLPHCVWSILWSIV